MRPKLQLVPSPQPLEPPRQPGRMHRIIRSRWAVVSVLGMGVAVGFVLLWMRNWS